MRGTEQELAVLSNTLEIKGIPPGVNESVDDLVCKVGKALRLLLTENDISSAYRKHKPAERLGHPPIVVRFVHQRTKEAILEKRRLKRNLSTKDIGSMVNGASNIYINDYLTPYYKKLYYEANLLKRAGKIKYLWVRNGNVLLRKEDGSRIINLKDILQLQNF